MRILIIKTSSMGDVIHMLPAITDIATHVKNATIDWVVEENFTEIPRWHPNIQRVIPVAVRRWRKKILSQEHLAQIKTFRAAVNTQPYDYIIDAQGLIKSAIISTFAQGQRIGFNWHSAREPLASFAYHKKYLVPRDVHAITRVRRLCAQALNYEIDETTVDYGLKKETFCVQNTEKYIVGLHGTTWATKHWPEFYWEQLIQKCVQAKCVVKLPWGNSAEKMRAEKLRLSAPDWVHILPRSSLTELASVLAYATAVVAVDTGLAHLAAALNVPTVSLYGSTDPKRTGTIGAKQITLAAEFACSPCLSRKCTYKGEKFVEPACFVTVNPERVWSKIKWAIEQVEERAVEPI